jgi:uncharacterized repeat protein (TIGR01451 family)
LVQTAPLLATAPAPAPTRSIFDHLRFAAAPRPPAPGAIDVRPVSSRNLVVEGSRPLPQAVVMESAGGSASQTQTPANPQSEAASVASTTTTAPTAETTTTSTESSNSSTAEPMQASSPPPPVRRIVQPQSTHPQNAYDLIRALQQVHQRGEQDAVSASAARPISVVARGNQAAPSVSLPAAPGTDAKVQAPLAPPARLLETPSFVAPAANLEPSHIDPPAAPVAAQQPSAARLNAADVRLAVHDPRGIVAAGEEAIYEIHVNNHGPEAARNIQVVVTVDPALTLVSAQGLGAKTAISTVVFDNIPRLTPHSLQILRFSVRASQPGGHQFRVELASADPRLRQAIEGTTRFGE